MLKFSGKCPNLFALRLSRVAIQILQCETYSKLISSIINANLYILKVFNPQDVIVSGTVSAKMARTQPEDLFKIYFF